MQPLILDLDSSVGELPGSLRIDFRSWHERLRFACSTAALAAFAQRLDRALPGEYGPVFFGSGDFHHLSLPLIEHTAARLPGGLRVVVFDNHPDNMRFPLGVHCGSWVSRVASLPNVKSVEVAGITSGDISLRHAWENRLRPLYNGALRYWSIGVDVRWASKLGLASAFRSFDGPDELMAALLNFLSSDRTPVYLSIDKDVLHPDEAKTNWDQGCLRVHALTSFIRLMRSRIVASDVNGEISVADYQQMWKRLLSKADGQATPSANLLASMQLQQHAVNLALCNVL